LAANPTQGVAEGAPPSDSWESLRLRFLQLQGECEGRLFAIWTAEPTPGVWQLRYLNGKDPAGFIGRFEALAQKAAPRLRSEAVEFAAVSFWLDRIGHDWPMSPGKTFVQGGPGDKRQVCSQDIEDVCYWSAYYCDRCAADEIRPRAPRDEKGAGVQMDEPRHTGTAAPCEPSLLWKVVQGEMQDLSQLRWQQEDIAIQKAFEILLARPEWAQTQVALLDAMETLNRDSHLSRWQRALNYYCALGEAWLCIVSDNKTAQAFYTLLPVLLIAVCAHCFPGMAPNLVFGLRYPEAPQFQRDVDQRDRTFRRKAAERAAVSLARAGDDAAVLGEQPTGERVGKPDKHNLEILRANGQLKRTVTLDVARRFGGVSRRAIDQAARKGLLKTEGKGQQRRVLVDSLLKYFPSEK
jgi:hypothetical protein